MGQCQISQTLAGEHLFEELFFCDFQGMSAGETMYTHLNMFEPFGHAHDGSLLLANYRNDFVCKGSCPKPPECVSWQRLPGLHLPDIHGPDRLQTSRSFAGSMAPRLPQSAGYWLVASSPPRAWSWHGEATWLRQSQNCGHHHEIRSDCGQVMPGLLFSTRIVTGRLQYWTYPSFEMINYPSPVF